MKRSICALVATILSLSACSSHQELKAKIFERKRISNDRLMIKYTYSTGKKTYYDSVFVRNMIIRNDSINIIIDPAHPQRSLPDFTR